MPGSDSRPNVVLVSIDSLRADHCGFLGDDRGLTPTLDRLAAEGLCFRNAVAPGPQTFSSMPAAMTGYPRPPGDVPEDDRSFWERRLAAVDAHVGRYGTVAERLRDLGYATAGFSPNPWASTAAGFDRGFDRFVDLAPATGDGGWLRRLGAHLPGVDPDSRSLQLAEALLTGESFFARWETFYDRLLATREALPEPYFLWVFLLDTHFPFVAGRHHRVEQSLVGTYASNVRSRSAMRGDADDLDDRVAASVRRSYRDTVRATDAFLARLRADLAADDPVLVVHSDHGESFGEHGNYGHHHRSVFEENVHVPYVVHNAGRSATVDEPVSLASIYDALVAAGRTGTVDPAPLTTSAALATSECGTRRALRGPRFKLVQDGDRELLFDLETDPDECHDLSADRADLHERCRSRLEQSLAHRQELTDIGRAAARVATGEQV